MMLLNLPRSLPLLGLSATNASMRVPVSTLVGAAFALGAGCVTTEAFLQSPVVGLPQQTATGVIASAAPGANKSGLEVLRPSATAAASCSRSQAPGLRPGACGSGSARGDEAGGKGSQAGNTKQPHASGSGGSRSGGGGKRLARPRSPSAAAAAGIAATAHLRQAAATTLAAVLLVASTEQDITTAMMGLDPSFSPAGGASKGAGQQSAMTLPKEDLGSGTPSPGSKPPALGSIDLTGQGTGAGEIPGSAGGGFKNGRLMVDVDSDLAMMLGKKMKTPDAEPLTH